MAPPLSPADPSPPSGPLRDPDSVVLCLLAIDEEEEDDIALQIHFTLIQSFCCDNDINIVRVSGMQRLAQLLGEPAETQGTTEARDLHCLLVTVSWASAVLPRPTDPAPGPCLSTKLVSHQLSTQPCLACPVGSRAWASVTQRAILSQPVFPKRALGEGGSPPTPGAPAEPRLLSPPAEPSYRRLEKPRPGGGS